MAWAKAVGCALHAVCSDEMDADGRMLGLEPQPAGTGQSTNE